jgi:hypothetical protein
MFMCVEDYAHEKRHRAICFSEHPVRRAHSRTAPVSEIVLVLILVWVFRVFGVNRVYPQCGCRRENRADVVYHKRDA